MAAVATLGLTVVGVTAFSRDDPTADSLSVTNPSPSRTLDPRADRDQRPSATPSPNASKSSLPKPAPKATTPAPKPSTPVSKAPPPRPAPTTAPPRKPPPTTPPPADKAPAPATCGASFYDQGETTANGEPFDPNGMTAAHKTLAFNTMVKITNTANGKSVTVRINDRGPFVEDRCLDLARGAFERIASVSTGVITVQFQVL